MIKTLKIRNQEFIKVKESKDLKEIKEALDVLLYVPDIRLRPMIIKKLIEYFDSKFSDKRYKLKFYIAYQRAKLSGFVISLIHPSYTSYGRKCGTFGWLHAKNFEICKALIKKCELFMKKNRIRRIRGNINFPKGMGGLGIQYTGFKQQMMYGVAFNDSNTKILNYLEKLGYLKESEYICMNVLKKTWNSGKKIDNGIKLRYLTLKELIRKKEDISELAKNSFNVILPDRSGFDEKFKEIINLYSEVPESHYKLKADFEPKNYSDITEFIEAWESCDLEKVVTWCPMAFDKKTEELIGVIFSLPDIYELWLGQTITRVNVDTVMVNKNYTGRGIFSALNNIGQLTVNLNGVNYVEGTYIWSNNKEAVNSIFPHCKVIRKFYVVQKRL